MKKLTFITYASTLATLVVGCAGYNHDLNVTVGNVPSVQQEKRRLYLHNDGGRGPASVRTVKSDDVHGFKQLLKDVDSHVYKSKNLNNKVYNLYVENPEVSNMYIYPIDAFDVYEQKRTNNSVHFKVVLSDPEQLYKQNVLGLQRRKVTYMLEKKSAFGGENRVDVQKYYGKVQTKSSCITKVSFLNNNDSPVDFGDFDPSEWKVNIIKSDHDMSIIDRDGHILTVERNVSKPGEMALQIQNIENQDISFVAVAKINGCGYGQKSETKRQPASKE